MTKFYFKRSALGVFLTNFRRDSTDFLKQFKKKHSLKKKNVQKKWHYFSLARKIKNTNLGQRIKPGQRRLTWAKERLVPKITINFPVLPKISISLPSPRIQYAVLKAVSFCFLLFVLGTPVFEKVFSPSNWIYRQNQKKEILSPLSNAYINNSQYSYIKKLDLSYLAEVIPTATPTPVPTVVTPETTLTPTLPVGTGGSPEVLSASDTAELATLLPSDIVSGIASESAEATESASISPIPTVEILPITTIIPTLEEPASVPVPTIVSDWNLPIVKIPKIAKRNLSAKEDLEISLDGYSPDIFEAVVTDVSGKRIKVETENQEGKIIVKQPTEFRPGKYQISLMVGETTLMTQDFTWGVLALNTNKSIFLPEETAKLSFAVLDEQGRMVCDANLNLKIRNPKSEIRNLSTEDGTIKVNPECESHNFTLNPDYEAQYLVDEVGQYDLELTAETQNGTYTINDSFEVRDSVAFDIERNSATRIYPPSEYPVYLNVLANEDYTGVIEEIVPSDFTISPVADNKVFDKTEEKDGVKVISWNVSLKKGEKLSLGYQYKAPEVSPQFYLLGPLTIKQLNNKTIFSESRQWQIASDAANDVILLWDTDNPFPDGWACLSCASTDPMYGVFPMAGNTYSGTTAGVDAHLHNLTYVGQSSAPNAVTKGNIATAYVVTIVSHEHADWASPTVGSGDVKPAYKNLEFISKSSPSVIPAKAIIILDTPTMPDANWTRYSALDGKYLRGFNNNAIGGTNVHNHGVEKTSSSFSNNINDNGNNSGDDGTASHSHTISGFTGNATNAPPYVDVVFAQNTSVEDVPLPDGMIAFFNNASLPTNWSSIGGTAPYANRFLRGASSGIGSTGGSSANHDHGSSVAITSSTYSTLRANAANTGTYFVSAAHSHVVTYNIDSVASLPAYRQIILGKYTAPPATVITVSGNIYTTETGTAYNCTTPNNKTVNVKVNGIGSATAECTAADGAYSVSGVTINNVNDVVTVYLSGGTEKATTVTEAADTISNISGLGLYQDRIYITHQNGGPISNTDLDQCDSTCDSNIQFTVTGSALTVKSGTKLVINTAKVYTPGGTVTTDSLSVGGTFNPEGNTVSFKAGGTGSTCTADAGTVMPFCLNGGTFNANTSNINYVAPVNTTVASTTYYSLGVGTSVETGIGATYTLGGNVTVENVLLVGNGSSTNFDTLYAASYILTLSGNSNFPFSLSNRGIFSAGTSTVNFVGPSSQAENNIPEMTFYNLGVGTSADTNPGVTYNLLGNVNVGGTFTVGNAGSTNIDQVYGSSYTLTLTGGGTPLNLTIKGNYSPGTSTVAYTATSATNIAATNYNVLSLAPASGTETYTLLGSSIGVGDSFVTSGGGTLTVNAETSDPTLDINGNFALASGHTFSSSSTGGFNVAGNFTNNGTFTPNLGTVTLDAGSTGKTITTNGSPFYKLTLNNSSGGWTLQDATKITDTLTITLGNFSAGSQTITLVKGGTPFVNNGTFTPATSTVNYVAPADTNITAVSYYNLGVGTSSETGVGATFSLGVSTTVGGTLTIGNASSTNIDTLNASSYTLTLAGAGTPLILTSRGAFAPATSTVNYIAPADTTLGATSYYNLGVGTSSEAGAGATFTLGGNVSVGGTFTIGNTTSTNIDTLNASSYTLALTQAGTALNITDKGAFASATGTVSFEAITNTTIPSLNYYNLSFNPASGTETYTNESGGTAESWLYRQPLTIDNSAGVGLSSYQISVNVGTSALIAAGKMQSSCQDMRFKDTDGSANLNYWIQSGCNTDSTKVWVNVPEISATSSKTIYLYYGNSDAIDAQDGNNTFDFFDDFNGDSLDTNKWQDWNPGSSGTMSVSGGNLNLSETSNGFTNKGRGIASTSDFTFSSAGTVLESRVKWAFAGADACRDVKITDGVPASLDAGNQYRFDYTSLSTRYRFVKNTSGSGSVVTYFSQSNNNPADYEIDKYLWYYVNPTYYQKGYQSTDGGNTFSDLWTNGTQSLFTLPTSKRVLLSAINLRATAANVYFDWIRIRKYSAIEPPTSLEAEESTSTGGGGSTINVANDFTTSGAGTLTADFETNDGTLDIGGNFTIASSDIFLASSTAPLTIAGNFTNNGTFTAGTGTVTMDAGSGSKTITTNGSPFYNLTFSNGSGGWTLQDATKVVNTLTLTSGDFSAGSQTLTLVKSGTPFVNSGTFTSAASTVNYIAAADTTVVGTSYYNLGVGTSSEAGVGATFTLGGNVNVGGTFTIGNAFSTNIDRLDNETGDKTVDINGDLVITSKGAFSSSSTASTTIARNFTNNGIFTAGTGTVTFDDADKTSAISYGGIGSTQPFYNLFITTPGKAMQFDETEMTGVGGSFYVQGNDCTDGRVFLDSTTSPDKWDINVTGNADVDYADIEDSNAITTLVANNSTEVNLGNSNWTINGGTCANVSVSGTLFSDEGSTAYNCTGGNSKTVAVRVNGLGSSSGICNGADGAFNVTGVNLGSNSSVVTLFVDGSSSFKGTTVTKNLDTASGITAPIYQNRILLTHEDIGPITNTNIGQCDSVCDSDNQFTVSGGVLTVVNGNKVVVKADKTYTPGGNITVDSLSVGGTFNLAGNSLRLKAGGTGGTCTADSGTVMPFCANGTVLLNNGTSLVYYDGLAQTTLLTTNYYDLAIGNSADTGVGATFTLGGDTKINGTLIVGHDSSANIDTLNASSYTLTLSKSGTPLSLTNEGAFAPATSTVNYVAPLATTVDDLTYYNLGVGTSSETGTGATFTLGGNVSVEGTFTVGNTGSTNIDTLNGSSYTLTLTQGGTPLNITSKGAFSGGTSTVKYTGQEATNITGGITYKNLEFAPAADSLTYTLGTGVGQTINATGNITIGNGTNTLMVTTTTNSPVMNISGDLIVNGSATLSGTGIGTITANGNVKGIGTINLTAGTFEQRALDNVSIGTTAGADNWTFNNLTFSNNKMVTGEKTNIDSASAFGALPGQGKQIVRTSDGTLYSILNDGGSCEVWKSLDGVTWEEKNGDNNPACDSGTEAAVAVDSTNKLHLAYHSGSVVKYETFTSDAFDLLNTTIIDNYAPDTGTLDIAVDSYNKPHVIASYNDGGGMPTNYYVVYTNKVGESWKPELETPISNAGVPSVLSLTIDNNDYPQYVVDISTGGIGALITAKGNANDPSSFSTYNSFGSLYASPRAAILIDSNGDTWISYIKSGGFVSLAKHTGSDWSTNWMTSITSNVGNEPSIAVNGTDVYVIYEDENDDIVYDKYDGSEWAGEKVLETGTYLDIKVRWSNLNNPSYATYGIDYLFSDGTDVYWNNLHYDNATITLNSGGSGNIAVGGTMVVGKASDFSTTTLDVNTNDRIIDVNNDVEITSNGTLSASNNASFTVGGSFSNSGTFTANSGTVTFDDAGKTSAISYGGVGSTQPFYNLFITTPGKPMQFDETEMTGVGGSFYVQGNSCTDGRVFLDSTTSPDKWDINVTGSADVDYADVEDSNALIALTANNSTGTNYTGWTVNTGVCGGANQNPASPTNLVQSKTDNTIITAGTWVNTTSIKIGATVSDQDASDTIYLCAEAVGIGTSFTNTETLCGDAVTYSETPLPASVTLTLANNTEYHWQVRVKDTGGLYSSWVPFGDGVTRDFGVDTSAPTGGTVFDGLDSGVDKSFNDGSLTQLSGNWSGIDAQVSGLSYYEYGIGTTAGTTDVKAWTNVGTGVSVTATGLSLQTSQTYFFNIRATDNAGNTAAVYSNGQTVAPSLTFSVNPASLSFADLGVGNSYSDSKFTTLTTSTNAYNGYVIRAYITDLLRSTLYPTKTIINFDGGTYASPGSWGAGNSGFGYTSSDMTIQGGNKFGGATLYAPFSQTGPGDIVADHTGNVFGEPIAGEAFTITNKVKSDGVQTAGPYATTVIYTITAQY